MEENTYSEERKPTLSRKITYFLWYMVKSPFEEIFYYISHGREFLLELRKPTRWIQFWIIGLAIYGIWFWGKGFKQLHLIGWLASIIILTGWYVWARGDWINEYRRKGLL